ncbi:hypothetical protein Tco_0969920 [Tanacetum coccineum]
MKRCINTLLGSAMDGPSWDFHGHFLTWPYLGRFNFGRTSLTGFPAQSVRSSSAYALDSSYLFVLNIGTSQSRQHDMSESVVVMNHVNYESYRIPLVTEIHMLLGYPERPGSIHIIRLSKRRFPNWRAKDESGDYWFVKIQSDHNKPTWEIQSCRILRIPRLHTLNVVSSPFGGLSDIGSPRVDEPPVMPEDLYAYVVAAFQALPSPDYVSGLEYLTSPDFVLEPVYPKFMPPEDVVLPAEEQPLPAALSPTADSPCYVLESDPEEDPEEDDDEDPEEDPADLSSRGETLR